MSKKRKCPATKKDGTPCNAYVFYGLAYCRAHAPELEEARRY